MLNVMPADDAVSRLDGYAVPFGQFFGEPNLLVVFTALLRWSAVY